MKKIILALAFVIFANGAIAAESILPKGDSKAPIEIDADALEVFQQEKKAIFTGSVVAKQGSMTVKAEKMTVFYSGENTSGNSISKIELNGNVVLTSPAESARSQYGIYDTVKNFVTLSGDVTLTRGGNILKGDKLDYNISTGYSKLANASGQTQAGSSSSGRVKGLFLPGGE